MSSKWTVRGGRFANANELRQAAGAVLGPYVQRAGYRVQKGIQVASPVRTGTLRRSWTTATPAWDGMILAVQVGSVLVYAAYQNYKTRNAGYVERGIEAARDAAVGEVRAGLAALGRAGWVRA